MNLSEFLEVLWRRKLIVLAVMLISIGVAVGALRLATKQYEASSTVAVLPTGAARTAIFILNVVDQITPLYADAATSPETLERGAGAAPGRHAARATSPSGRSPARRSSRSSRATPKPLVAQQSAQAVTTALLEREAAGTLKFSPVRLEQLNRARVPTEPVFPRPTLTLAVALLLGLGFGVGAALLRENLTTKVETPEALARIAGRAVLRARSRTSPRSPASTRRRTSPIRSSGSSPRRCATCARTCSSPKGNLRSIVVTSPEGSHGKTTVAFGLAVVVRALGRAHAARRRRPAQGPGLGAAQRAAHARPDGGPARPPGRDGDPAHVARQPRLRHGRPARRGPGRAAHVRVPEPAAPVRAVRTTWSSSTRRRSCRSATRASSRASARQR